jgi:hypothetical protein
MKKIAQDLEQYKNQIKELEEHALPTTPPEVTVQRDQDTTVSTENIALDIQKMTELLEKSGQLWTQLQEDGSLQELQGKEDRVHVAMVELKQKQKMMSLPEKIKTAAEMKSLQSEEKAVQANNIARKAQLEPLQEKAEQLVMEIDAEKSKVEHIGLEGGEILKPPVIVQMVEAMAEKRNQAQGQYQQATEMYEALAQAVKDARVSE